MAAQDNPFWDFAWTLYHESGVAEACLGLQERHGVDVNLLLFCIWAGHCGTALEAEDLRDLMGRVAGWHGAVVRPLRGVRRWLKDQEAAPQDAAEMLRQAVKRDELEAERLEQATLHAARPMAPAATPAPAAAIGSLAAYFSVLDMVPGVADSADLATLLTAAFGDRIRPLDAVWRLQTSPG